MKTKNNKNQIGVARSRAIGSSTRLSVRITAFLLIGMIWIVLLEVGARFLLPKETDFLLSSRLEIYPRLYSSDEMDKTKPLQLARQGGNCTKYRLDKDRIYYNFHWNPWWGYSGKLLDPDCAKKLFARHPIKVVLLGGSSMDNAEAPNYLTRIDYLAFGGDDRIASINLAESGARLSNNLARFIHEAIDLKPDVAVFLAGFNEFLSISYGGQSGYDYHWTAGVSRRMEEPNSVLLERLASISRLTRELFIHTRFANPAALKKVRGPSSSPVKDVEIYLRDREVLQTLCRHYAIECVFILQPTAFIAGPADKSAARAVSLYEKFFPYDTRLYRDGYELLRKSFCDNCVDASTLFDDVQDGYFDVAHFTKNGGAKLAKLIHQQVLDAYSRKMSQENNHRAKAGE
jgi:hypothetical protein